jgi:hypothetical protein
MNCSTQDRRREDFEGHELNIMLVATDQIGKSLAVQEQILKNSEINTDRLIIMLQQVIAEVESRRTNSMVIGFSNFNINMNTKFEEWKIMWKNC